MPFKPVFQDGIFTGDVDLNLADQIRTKLAQYNLEELSDTVLGLITEYGVDMEDTVNAKLRETQAYKNRFIGNESLKASKLGILTEAEYLYNERQYAEVLSAYSSSDLGTRANYAEFIGKSISPTELADRFKVAVDKVNNSDPALKKQIQKMYPGISDMDLSRSLLMGKEGSVYLESRIGQAEILAEADVSNITLQSDVAELQRRGVDRTKAAEGLSAIADYMPGLQQAAERFGDNADPAGLQRELESQVLLGSQSKRVKRLASQARSSFEGTSGSTAGSLKKKTSGLI